MFKRKIFIFIFIIVILSFCIMHAAALQQNLHEQVDQYYSNKELLEDLNKSKTHLEEIITNLNNSLIKSDEQIQNINNNIKVLDSEIAALEGTIQDNKNKINETERNIHRIGSLSDKVSTILLGISGGMIAGLWITSLALVSFWRR
jgi:peptidoglycan hydrolase CwlO-like protein